LKPAVRNKLTTIINEVTAERNKISTEINNANRQKIIDAGKAVRTLNAAQRAAWVNALKPVWKKFEKNVGAALIAAAQRANAGS
jgi:C4-dicarboxylate-binding protein DctP